MPDQASRIAKCALPRESTNQRTKLEFGAPRAEEVRERGKAKAMGARGAGTGARLHIWPEAFGTALSFPVYSVGPFPGAQGKG